MAISLAPMTDEMYYDYFREYENDPDLYFDKSTYRDYVYSREGVESYIRRKREKKQIPLAILADGEIVGELIFKNLIPGQSVTIGICLKNDGCKGRGYGTQAEKQALEYAFEVLKVQTVLADALIPNTRSQHVLEKVGFQETHRDDMFVYYQCKR